MNEKIVLTVEQGKAVENFKEQNDSLEYLAIRKSESKAFKYMYKAFNDMTLDEIVKALYVGYEVEKPKFEVGEWVTRNKTMETDDKGWLEGYTFQIMSIGSVFNRSIPSAIESTGRSHNLKSLRHATPEEIIFAELGREVGEFKDGDQIITTWDAIARVDTSRKDSGSAKELYKASQLKGFYPSESFIKFP
jgi:hypothetical protein